MAKKRKGPGFLSGAIVGALFVGANLLGLSLAVGRPGASEPVTAEAAPPATAPAPPAPAPAPAAAESEPVAAPEPTVASDAGTEIATAPSATPLPDTPASDADDADPSEGTAEPAAGAPGPARPAWIAEAAAFQPSDADAPRLAIAFLDPDETALEALAGIGAPISVVLDGSAPIGLFASARDLGMEALQRIDARNSLGERHVKPLVGMVADDRVAPGAMADALLAVSARGMMVAHLGEGAGADVLRDAAREYDLPFAQMAIALGPDASGDLVLAALQEGERRARDDGAAAIALPATPTAIRAFARWRALGSDADAAPLSALASQAR